MKVFKKIKNKLGILALFGLLFQLTMPVYQTYVYAEENGINIEVPKEQAESAELPEVELPEVEVEDPALEVDSEAEIENENEEVQDLESDTDLPPEDGVEPKEEQGQSIVEEELEEELEAEPEAKEEIVESKVQPANLTRALQSIEDYFAVGMDSNILTTGVLSFRNETTGPTTTPTVSSIARIDFTWEIPEVVAEQVQAGDFFIFQLPAALKITQPITRDLADSSGQVYGSFTTSTSGQVVMTFNDEVSQTVDGVRGDLWFESQLDETMISEAGTVEIVLPVREQATVEVFIKTDYANTIEKKGEVDSVLNPAGITWTVDFNKGLNTLTNVNVTDTFPVGNPYVSVKVYKLTVNLQGQVVGETEVTSGFTVDPSGNVTFPGTISDAYRLVYETSISDSIKEAGGNSVRLKNKAVLTSDENTEGLVAEATVTANFGKMIDKVRSRYDRKNQVFTWIARYNYGEQTINEIDAKLVDVMDNRLELIASSLVIKKVIPVSARNETFVEDLVLGTHYTVIPTATGFEVQFLEDVDYAVKMTYQTRVKAGTIIDDSTEDNSAQITNTITTTGGAADSSGDNLEQRGVIKTSAGIDYSTKRIGWKIRLNENRYQMNDATLSDDFTNRGLTFDAATLVIKDDTIGTTLLLGTDYTVTTKPANAGFDIEFLGTYKTSMDSTLTITYETPYVFNDLNPGQSRFKNTATLTWKDNNNNEYINSDSTTVRPKSEVQDNGFKNGSYNAVSKIISWNVGVNYNGEEIQTGAQISDPFTGNQVYVPGSAKLYEYTVKVGGGIEKGALVTPATVIEPTVSDNTLTVTLPADAVGTTKGYLLEFETSLDGQIVENENQYTNTAFFTNGDNPVRELTGKLSIEFDEEFINKSGSQNIEDGQYVDWSVAVNRSQSTVENAKIVDQPSTNQILVADSVALYPLTAQADGSFIKETTPLVEDVDYTLVVTTASLDGQQEITITFINEIDQAYELNYTTLLNLNPDDKSVTNKITFTGENIRDVISTEETVVEVESSSGGGSASGEKGRITFQKKGPNGELMAGVKFELWDKDKTAVVRTGTTDENGLLTFGNIIRQDYYLKEVATLPGYTVSDELVAGIKVTVTGETSETIEDIDVSLVNELSKVIIEKVNEVNNPLPGAEFKLFIKTASGNYEELNERQIITTNESGTITLEGLLPGEYRLEETKAPIGYLLNTEPIDFEVKKEGVQVPTVGVKAINYQGSVTLTKVNAEKDDQALLGAEFSLLDKDGNVLQSGLMTDEQGQIRLTDLAPGEYAFIETKAPTGYELTNQLISFTIASESAGAPEEIELVFKNKKVVTSATPIAPRPPKTEGTALPQTGEATNQLIYLIGGLLIFVGLFIGKRIKE